MVAANRQPDFRTICRFRAEHEEAFEDLFVEVLIPSDDKETGKGIGVV